MPSTRKYQSKAQTYAVPQKHPRAEITGQVMIHDDAHLFIAPLSNLSAGGVFIEKLISIPTGSTVKIVMKSEQLPQPVQVEGTVVRVQRVGNRGLAVQFKNLGEPAKDAIESYVLESRVDSALKIA